MTFDSSQPQKLSVFSARYRWQFIATMTGGWEFGGWQNN